MAPARWDWPEGRAFGLFLSHDVDQIHDRELFRVLADLNHVRRVWTQGERGNAALALRRVARALVAPNPAEKDFGTILEIEARHGFRSTFFVLHDPYWSRHGPRYRLTCPELRRIADLVRGAGCEIGLHGGYLRFNQAAFVSRGDNHDVDFTDPQFWDKILGPRMGEKLLRNLDVGVRSGDEA